MNKKLIPVMLCFFTMGFVDMVGIASNYVKADLSLSDSMANTLPSLVFLWFLIFSIPTSLLMNKIGRKNTVLLSLVMTLAAMAIPVFSLDFAMLLVSFSLLGIGNAIMQTSLNPLVDSVMKGGASASTLTFVQFESMEWGIRAAFCLLRTYSKKYKAACIEDIIRRWAPPSENDTNAYIRNVCRLTGFGGQQRLTEEHWPRLVRAMALIECGADLSEEIINKGYKLYKNTKA